MNGVVWIGLYKFFSMRRRDTTVNLEMMRCSATDRVVHQVINSCVQSVMILAVGFIGRVVTSKILVYVMTMDQGHVNWASSVFLVSQDGIVVLKRSGSVIKTGWLIMLSKSVV